MLPTGHLDPHECRRCQTEFERGIEMKMYPTQFERFMGMTTTVGTALMDPGAQDGCVGKIAYLDLCSRLEEIGLKCKEFPVPPGVSCGGVGGSSKLVLCAEIPVGVATICGIMRVHVTEDAVGSEVPLLFPVNLCRGLKAVIDTDTGVCVLKAHDVQTQMESMPSGHWEISIMEYPEDGWTIPEAAAIDYNEDEYYIADRISHQN